ncbi:MAG: type 4a pilus biogenesis protein PilO [Candidatus Omnitrophica bacterium]|nr:type 4a pilus biogenesis protein PilO [Candidatus Omnitrophota bacterium]
MSKLNRLLEKERIVFIVLALICLFGIFFVLPVSFTNAFRIGKAKVGVNDKLNQVKAFWPQKDQYHKNIKSLTEEIDSVQSKIIESQQEPEFLSFVSSKSKEFNIDIEILQPLSQTFYINLGDKVLNYFPVKIKAKGSYHDLQKFIDYVQNSRYFMEIKELKLSFQGTHNTIEILLCGVIQNKKEQ